MQLHRAGVSFLDLYRASAPQLQRGSVRNPGGHVIWLDPNPSVVCSIEASLIGCRVDSCVKADVVGVGTEKIGADGRGA